MHMSFYLSSTLKDISIEKSSICIKKSVIIEQLHHDDQTARGALDIMAIVPFLFHESMEVCFFTPFFVVRYW